MRYVAGALCALLLWPGVVYAETLEPRAVQYDFEEKQDSTTKSCNVILTLLSMPAPEVVKFTFTEVSGNGVSAPIAVGFYLDVGDFQFANGNQLPFKERNSAPLPFYPLPLIRPADFIPLHKMMGACSWGRVTRTTPGRSFWPLVPETSHLAFSGTGQKCHGHIT